MDFTIEIYKRLLNTLSIQGFSFRPFQDYISSTNEKVIILRHDVDLLPLNSLEFAKIEAKNGIKGTYYFRIVPEFRNTVVPSGSITCDFCPFGLMFWVYVF